MGPLIPLLWTSGDVSSGFQSQRVALFALGRGVCDIFDLCRFPRCERALTHILSSHDNLQAQKLNLTYRIETCGFVCLIKYDEKFRIERTVFPIQLDSPTQGESNHQPSHRTQHEHRQLKRTKTNNAIIRGKRVLVTCNKSIAIKF